MSDPVIVALVDELEALGVRFTVLPRLDGSLRLNTWRTQDAWLNRDRINRIIAERIENSPETATQMAEFIAERPTKAGLQADEGCPP